MLAQMNLPSTIILGGGASRELVPQLQRLSAQRVLVVSDNFLQQTGVVGRILSELETAGIKASVYAGVQPDPTVANVMEGWDLLRTCQAEVVIALGGGSPIDAAKVIAVLAANPSPVRQYEGYHRIPRPGLPLVAIPTTAGTGSEMTRVAVITDTERDVKMMLLDAHLVPRIALVDYELTLTMPASLTAHVGVDTLTHGIEAYISRRANSLTDPLALSCVELVSRNLLTAFAEPNHCAAREAMMTAASLGGMAFANSSVCLVHGMSRPLGALYHVPHGLSNAVLLPTVTRFSLPGAPERYAELARRMRLAGADDSIETAGDALNLFLLELNRKLGIGRLRDVVSVDWPTFSSRMDAMAEAALASGSPQNNPRVPTADEIKQLYREAW